MCNVYFYLKCTRRMDKKSSAPKPPPVPPPAAPPNVQAYLAHAPLIKAKQVRFKISAQDLELERKKLKKPYEIKKQGNKLHNDCL